MNQSVTAATRRVMNSSAIAVGIVTALGTLGVGLAHFARSSSHNIVAARSASPLQSVNTARATALSAPATARSAADAAPRQALGKRIFFDKTLSDPVGTSCASCHAMSDNFHQSIQGGTGANHVAIGTGDAVWFSDGAGNPLIPPTLNAENPNPQAGTNNWYTQDGYSGGTYSNCSDTTQPGVGPVVSYLNALNVKPNCDKGHYYLLNNYNPGYFGDGTVASGQFTIPPTSTRTIGDELLEHHISWRYYGENWNNYVADPDASGPGSEYCNICNPFQYASSIMTNDKVRNTYLKDTTDFYSDVESGWLPAFSIIKPSGLLDGHPASSKLDLFEGFSKKVVDAVRNNPALFEDTVIFITFDEGGGYYDSGFVSPIDFFGDGTRIPLIAVSPFASDGYLSHNYADHVSLLKFVERNWNLEPITKRSRDNLPNPTAASATPWVPSNAPALDDLFDLFDFDGTRTAAWGPDDEDEE
jgi:phospholipase C